MTPHHAPLFPCHYLAYFLSYPHSLHIKLAPHYIYGLTSIHPGRMNSLTHAYMPLTVEHSHAHLLASSYTHIRHMQSQMPMALSSDTAPGATLYQIDIPDILRHAGVGVLSLRRAPNLGKLARATRIPAPGPISSSLTLTLSPCGICRLASPP